MAPRFVAKAWLLPNFLTASRNRFTLGQKLRGGENKNIQVVTLRIRVPRVCKNLQKVLKKMWKTRASCEAKRFYIIGSSFGFHANILISISISVDLLCFW